MNQPNATARISSHAGLPQSSTLRKPLLYTASTSTTDPKTQIIFASLMGEQFT